MDIAVYIVRENKCPSCGMKGVFTSLGVYECHNEKVHTDQILFKIRRR